MRVKLNQYLSLTVYSVWNLFCSLVCLIIFYLMFACVLIPT